MTLDPNTLVLLAIALVNAVTAFMTYRTGKAVTVASAEIQKIELATNSMKDALVASTAKASHAEGKEAGRIQAESERK